MSIKLKNKGKIILNGKEYSGSALTIKNNKVYIDGQFIDTEKEEKNGILQLNLNIYADVENVDCECETLTIYGDVGKVKTTNGNIEIHNNVNGSINTINGNVSADEIYGDIETVNGNVQCVKKRKH